LGPMLESIVSQDRDTIPMFEQQGDWKMTSVSIDRVAASALSLACRRYGITDLDCDQMSMGLLLVKTFTEVRKISLSDFPLCLEDSRYLKAFHVDCGVSSSEVVRPTNVFIALRPMFEVPDGLCLALFSATIEELVRRYYPVVSSLFLMCFEGIALKDIKNVAVHGFLYFVADWRLRLIFHWTYNVYEGVRSRKYAAILVCAPRLFAYGYGLKLLRSRGVLERLVKQGTDVLTPMSDCSVPPKNNRITDYFETLCGKVYSHSVPNCTKKTKSQTKNAGRKTRQQQKQPKGEKKTKGSLGRTLLTSGLGALGGLVGAGPGSAVGSTVGNFLSDILGAGDYEVKENSIMTSPTAFSSGGVPTFHSNKRSVRVRHREYLGDVTGSTAFSLVSYNLNPGLEATFPWLSSLAENFQEYRFHGLIFEFWSTSADALNSINTALGTVIMGTQYNAARSNFTSKAEMEMYEFTCSSKPSMSMIHPIECAQGEAVLDELYIRTGALPATEVIQFYDHGKFQIATVGMQAAANIGELWVSYDVELFKPRIAPGGAWPGQFTRVANGPYTNASVLGTLMVAPIGNLGVDVISTTSGFDTIRFPSSLTGGCYYVNVILKGNASVLVNWINPTLTNLALVNRFDLNGAGQMVSPSGGTNSSATVSYSAVVRISGYSPTGSIMVFSSAMTLPTTQVSVSIYVICVPDSETFV